MRITRRERFERRIQFWDGLFRFPTPEWLRWRRCVKCSDDVLNETMWRFRESDHAGSWWAYLCASCAGARRDALEYWADHEKGS